MDEGPPTLRSGEVATSHLRPQVRSALPDGKAGCLGARNRPSRLAPQIGPGRMDPADKRRSILAAPSYRSRLGSCGHPVTADRGDAGKLKSPATSQVAGELDV